MDERDGPEQKNIKTKTEFNPAEKLSRHTALGHGAEVHQHYDRSEIGVTSGDRVHGDKIINNYFQNKPEGEGVTNVSGLASTSKENHFQKNHVQPEKGWTQLNENLYINHWKAFKGRPGVYKGKENLDGSPRDVAIRIIDYNESLLGMINRWQFRQNHHPNVIEIYDANAIFKGDKPYIYVAMKTYPQTLKDFIQENRNKPFDFEQNFSYARQIVEGVAFIHEYGLHGNIRLENILISSEDRCIISDFNLTHPLQEQKPETDATVFDAPETYDEVPIYSLLSDSFSIGIVLSMLFSGGIHPFGSNIATCRRHIMNNKACDLSAVRTLMQAYPQKKMELLDLLGNLLSHDPKNRYTPFEILKDNFLKAEPDDSQPSSKNPLLEKIEGVDKQTSVLRLPIQQKTRALHHHESSWNKQVSNKTYESQEYENFAPNPGDTDESRGNDGSSGTPGKSVSSSKPQWSEIGAEKDSFRKSAHAPTDNVYLADGQQVNMNMIKSRLTITTTDLVDGFDETSIQAHTTSSEAPAIDVPSRTESDATVVPSETDDMNQTLGGPQSSRFLPSRSSDNRHGAEKHDAVGSNKLAQQQQMRVVWTPRDIGIENPRMQRPPPYRPMTHQPETAPNRPPFRPQWTQQLNQVKAQSLNTMSLKPHQQQTYSITNQNPYAADRGLSHRSMSKGTGSLSPVAPGLMYMPQQRASNQFPTNQIMGFYGAMAPQEATRATYQAPQYQVPADQFQQQFMMEQTPNIRVQPQPGAQYVSQQGSTGVKTVHAMDQVERAKQINHYRHNQVQGVLSRPLSDDVKQTFGGPQASGVLPSRTPDNQHGAEKHDAMGKNKLAQQQQMRIVRTPRDIGIQNPRMQMPQPYQSMSQQPQMAPNRPPFSPRQMQEPNQDQSKDLDSDSSGSDDSGEGKRLTDTILIFNKRQIGVGTRVYEGRCTKTNMDLAIKVLTRTKNTKKECRLLKKLKHENIVNVIKVGKYPGTITADMYIVMERCQENLSDYIERNKQKPINFVTAFCFSKQLVTAVVYLHENKVVHRDLKPWNILISKCGKIKVADMGISRTVTDGKTATTVTHILAGSKGFKAPETYKQNFKHDTKDANDVQNEIDYPNRGDGNSDHDTENNRDRKNDDLLENAQDTKKQNVGEKDGDGGKYSFRSDIFPLGINIYYIFSNGKHPFGDDPHGWEVIIKNHSMLPKLKQISEFEEPYTEKRDQLITLLEQMLNNDPLKRPLARDVLENDFFQEISDRTAGSYHPTEHEYNERNQGREKKKIEIDNPTTNQDATPEILDSNKKQEAASTSSSGHSIDMPLITFDETPQETQSDSCREYLKSTATSSCRNNIMDRPNEPGPSRGGQNLPEVGPHRQQTRVENPSADYGHYQEDLVVSGNQHSRDDLREIPTHSTQMNEVPNVSQAALTSENYNQVTRSVGPEGKTIEIGGCCVTFPSGCLEKTQCVTVGASINPKKRPDIITPTLHVKAEGLTRPATVELTTWCVVDDGQTADSTVDVLCYEEDSKQCNIVFSCQLGKSQKIVFEVKHFSDLFAIVRNPLSINYTLLPRVCFYRDHFVIAMSLDTALATEECIRQIKERWGPDLTVHPYSTFRCKTSHTILSKIFPETSVNLFTLCPPQLECTVNHVLEGKGNYISYHILRSKEEKADLTMLFQLFKDDELRQNHGFKYQWRSHGSSTESTIKESYCLQESHEPSMQERGDLSVISESTDSALLGKRAITSAAETSTLTVKETGRNLDKAKPIRDDQIPSIKDEKGELYKLPKDDGRKGKSKVHFPLENPSISAGFVNRGEHWEKSVNKLTMIRASTGQQGITAGNITEEGGKSTHINNDGTEIIGATGEDVKTAIDALKANKVDVAIKYSDGSPKFKGRYGLEQTIYDVTAEMRKIPKKYIDFIRSHQSEKALHEDTSIAILQQNGQLHRLTAVLSDKESDTWSSKSGK